MMICQFCHNECLKIDKLESKSQVQAQPKGESFGNLGGLGLGLDNRIYSLYFHFELKTAVCFIIIYLAIYYLQGI